MPKLRLVLLAALALLALAVPASASAAREIPVGIANTNEQNLRDSHWLYAIRFVVDHDTNVHRFLSGFKAQGASWDEHRAAKCSRYGAGCYGAGDGGTIEARLVAIKPDGTPDLTHVLGRDVARASDRYFQSKSAYGVPSGFITQLWYWNMGGAHLRGGQPYAMVYRNVGADPTHNFSSAQSPVVKASEAGPNGRNNLDPNAHGAIAGLDPREAVAWSENGGGSWSWGRDVGPYHGDPNSDDGTRLPWYGWQSSPGSRPESNQPYYNYWSTCSRCTLVARSVPRHTAITQAGGYAPAGRAVGVVTVRNASTGETGHTGSLGSGLARGRLNHPVTVEPGDTYEVTNTGTVYRAEADVFIERVFGVGGGAHPFTTRGFEEDEAQLFALPHPWFGRGASSAVVVRRATLSGRKGASVARRGGRVSRGLRVRGYVVGGGAERGRRVAIQMRRGSHWRTVARGRLRSGGRFSVRGRVRLSRSARRARLSALVRGVGRSRALRVRVR